MGTSENPYPPGHTDEAEHTTKLAEKTIAVSEFSHDFSFLLCSCLSAVMYPPDGGNRYPRAEKIPDWGGKKKP